MKTNGENSSHYLDFVKKNILITWLPKSGKTTLLKSILADFDAKVWFWTDEIRIDGRRVGFGVVPSVWEKSILAHINNQGPLKVGKYWVDIQALDWIIPGIDQYTPADILYIDEIGEMELYSPSFRGLVSSYLNSWNVCIMTLSEVFNDDFTRKIRCRDDIILVKITEENRLAQEEYIKRCIPIYD